MREGCSQSSKTEATAAFVLKINVRALAVVHFAAVSSVRCCRLHWQNGTMGDDGGLFYTQSCGCC